MTATCPHCQSSDTATHVHADSYGVQEFADCRGCGAHAFRRADGSWSWWPMRTAARERVSA